MPGFVMTNGDPDTGKSWRKQSDVEGRQVGGSALSGQTGEKQVNGQFTPKDHDSKRGDPSGDVSRDVLSAMAGPPNDAPPDIEHITVGYQPLSKLVMRLSQETFNELREVIEAMADMSPSQTSNGHNHYKPMNNTAVVNGDDDSPLNIQKKMRLMNFVQDRRAQFIKVLVLAQWSRQSQDVSKVIDLKVWLDKQRFLYDEAGYWLGDLKRSLEPAKMPNPDLRTALAVLSTGKASWLPDVSSGLSKISFLYTETCLLIIAWICAASTSHTTTDAQDSTKHQYPPFYTTQPSRDSSSTIQLIQHSLRTCYL